MKASEAPIWDVVIIGGGPAGMMAAGTAAAEGARVLLLEKNPSLGKKLLITGGGRCNVTNAELDTRKLLEKYGDSGKFLFSAFSQWSVQDSLDFFHTREMETKIENELRVFPVSNKAQSVHDVLTSFMRAGNVVVRANAAVKKFISSKEKVEAVELFDGLTGRGEIIKAKSFILATGGKSHPKTGSTGDGFTWLRDLGHTVIDSTPSLVPIKLSDPWVKDLAGVSLPMVKFALFHGAVRQSIHKGKLLFTHVGASGPAILNMSHEISELLDLESEPVTLVADLVTAMDHKQVDTAILESFAGEINKKFKNITGELLPSALMQTLGKLANIDPETPCHSVSRESRLQLVQLIKALPLHVSGLLGLEKAVITSGGVVLEEVDFKTMRSRKIQNLYLTGDILNINRPTGGYSLQLCWTTGSIAGRNSIK